jgi:hypothetical protein
MYSAPIESGGVLALAIAGGDVDDDDDVAAADANAEGDNADAAELFPPPRPRASPNGCWSLLSMTRVSCRSVGRGLL